jgi:hypothetical protein
VAGAPSREEPTAFVARAVVGRVLADRSGVGGPHVAFACGAWTDRRRPLKPAAYRDTVVETFKGSASAVNFVDQVSMYGSSCFHLSSVLKKLHRWIAASFLSLSLQTPARFTSYVAPSLMRSASLTGQH